VVLSDNVWSTPTAASLSITGIAPEVLTPVWTIPAPLALTLTGHAPVVYTVPGLGHVTGMLSARSGLTGSISVRPSMGETSLTKRPTITGRLTDRES